MSSLILDKSVVVAAGQGVLGALRSRQFSFILTDTLMYEIATERLADRDLLCERDTRKLDSRIGASLAKTREVGNVWVESSDALRWEIVHGESARSGPRLVLKESFSLQGILDILVEVGKACLSHDAAVGRLASASHATADEAAFKKVRGMDLRSFFRYLEGQLSSPHFLQALPAEVRNAKRGQATLFGRQIG